MMISERGRCESPFQPSGPPPGASLQVEAEATMRVPDEEAESRVRGWLGVGRGERFDLFSAVNIGMGLKGAGVGASTLRAARRRAREPPRRVRGGQWGSLPDARKGLP